MKDTASAGRARFFFFVSLGPDPGCFFLMAFVPFGRWTAPFVVFNIQYASF